MLFCPRKGIKICQEETEPALPVVVEQEAAAEAAAESKPTKQKTAPSLFLGLFLVFTYPLHEFLLLTP